MIDATERPSIFQPHGLSDLWCANNIVYAKLLGTWNLQAAEAFAAEFKQVAAPCVKQGAWGHLVLLEDWDLCAAEVFPVIAELVDWCISNNLKRAAQIYPPSPIKSYFIDQMVIEEQGDFKRRTFDSENEGLQWLQAEMSKLHG